MGVLDGGVEGGFSWNSQIASCS